MTCVIVPNWVANAINKEIDEALAKLPTEEARASAVIGREEFYQQLLHYYNEHGVVPSISLEKRTVQ